MQGRVVCLLFQLVYLCGLPDSGGRKRIQELCRKGIIHYQFRRNVTEAVLEDERSKHKNREVILWRPRFEERISFFDKRLHKFQFDGGPDDTSTTLTPGDRSGLGSRDEVGC